MHIKLSPFPYENSTNPNGELTLKLANEMMGYKEGWIRALWISHTFVCNKGFRVSNKKKKRLEVRKPMEIT